MKKPITLTEHDGIKKLSLPPELNSHLSTLAYLYLQPNGWFADYPCDSEGITPWYTFPAITFLKDIIDKSWNVLEFGSGYSTLYFYDNVTKLTTIEHDQDWANKLSAENSNLNIEVIQQNSSNVNTEAYQHINDYKKSFVQIQSNDYSHDLKHGLINQSFEAYASKIYDAPLNFYDLVVIDGMARSLCAMLTVRSLRLKENGVIILDNSDRWHYNPIQKFLTSEGYGRLDFWGPGWNNHAAWCTSFYSKKFPINNNRLLRPETLGHILT